jgi:phosphohistidine phosphatase SixA
MRLSALLVGLALVIILAATRAGAQPDRSPESTLVAVAKVRDPGVVGLLRHARAPGAGDPAGFSLAECSTQRLLSDDGRRQARAIGDLLRRTGVREARVLSSAWCRCLETARLLEIGAVEVAPHLNSFYAGRGDRAVATMELRRAVLGKVASLTPTIMVTHQVNITALTGLVPAEGELIFIRGTAAGGIEVVGRARVD